MRAALLLFLLAAAAAAQPTFRLDVRLVNVTATVRSADGRLIDDLTQDDFEIREDGVPQKIAFFARSDDVPLRLGLAVDISGSQEAFVRAHQRDLKALLEKTLSDRDRAFLVCFGAHPRLIVDYASSARRLVDGLEGYIASDHKNAYPMLGPSELRVGGTSFYDAIYHASNQMFQAEERGRKALIVFSDGEDNASARHMMETAEAAQSNDVALFGIRYTETSHGRWTSRNKYGRSVMERLAFETGGAVFDAAEKNVAAHFREIGDQLRMSYELAYQSTNVSDDRTFHKLLVRVKRPGAAVRAKTGYYAR